MFVEGIPLPMVRVLEKRAICDAADHSQQVRAAETFLLPLLPAPDENVDRIDKVIAQIDARRDLVRVTQLATAVHMSRRSLQRLFQTYVGVSPKWVIKRCRLHDAAHTLAGRPATDWSALARSLGYYDQAHFINDFRNIVGRTPTAYAEEQDP